VNIVVLDASAGAEIVAQTGTGRRLLALTPRNRTWWAPDHFHVEATGAIRRRLMKGLIRGDRKLAGAPKLPIQVLHLSPAV
jgi:predicted nucleic acid-binding protein